MASVYGVPGKHEFVDVEVADVNANTPFESTIADEYEFPYIETGNGSEIAVVPWSV